MVKHLIAAKYAVKEFLFPTPEQVNVTEAQKLLITLLKRYSIEEQSNIVHQLKQELIQHREEEIANAEKHLERLKSNLSSLKNHVNI